jgi:hypothetical protein
MPAELILTQVIELGAVDEQIRHPYLFHIVHGSKLARRMRTPA